MGNSRRARARRMAERIWVQPEEQEGYWFSPGAPEHGVWNGYNTWYCRCPECKGANTSKVVARRAREEETSAATRI